MFLVILITISDFEMLSSCALSNNVNEVDISTSNLIV